MTMLAKRLEAAWHVLHGSIGLPDDQFRIVFDEVEGLTLADLRGSELIMGIEGLNAHLARLKGRRPDGKS